MSTVLEVVSAVLLVLGALLALTAAIGLLRFPDTLARMHAATKPQTLGLLLVLAGTALLLVSTLPVWSFKNFKVPREYVLPLLLGVGTFAAVLVEDPWAAFIAAGLIYVGMLPFSRRSFHRLRREAEEGRV